MAQLLLSKSESLIQTTINHGNLLAIKAITRRFFAQHHIPLFHQFHPASNLLEPPVRHSGLNSDWLSLFVSGHSLTVLGLCSLLCNPAPPFQAVCDFISVISAAAISACCGLCWGVCLSARIWVWKSREVSEQTHADKYKLVKWKEKEITTLFVLTWSWLN